MVQLNMFNCGRKLTLACLLLLSLSATALCDTRLTREEVVLMQIANAIGVAESIGDTVPTNWSSLNKFVNLDVTQQVALLNSPAFPLQKHYVFTPSGMQIRGPLRQGEIKLINHSVVYRDNRGHGRYVVYGQSNSYHYAWITENIVQSLIKASGINVPTPDPETVRLAELAGNKLRDEQKSLDTASSSLFVLEWKERLQLGLKQLLFFSETTADGTVRSRVRPVLVYIMAAGGVFLLVYYSVSLWRRSKSSR